MLRLPSLLALAALVLVVPLAVWNLWPGPFPARAHQGLAALPLALISAGQFLHRLGRRPGRRQLLHATFLSTGFLLWAATQLWPDWPRALVLNDVAIALFVTDLYLGITGERPEAATSSSTPPRPRPPG
jgi:hypothetical protein